MWEELLKNGAYLWTNRKRLVLGALPFLILGILYAIFSASAYTVKVNVFPKESGMGRGGGNFSISGISLRPFQNTLIEKMDFIVLSEEIAEMVVRRDTLLPVLYPKLWDANEKNWRKPAPSSREGAQTLQSMLVTSGGKSYLGLMVTTRQADLSLKVMRSYLEVLNEKMRNDARIDMERNVAFLETQLAVTQDPMLRDKLQELIASQLENFMYQGASAFDVVGDLRRPLKPDSSNRILVILVSLFAGLALSGFVLILLRDQKDWMRAWSEARAPRAPRT